MTDTEQFKPFPLAPAVLAGNQGTIIRPNGRKASLKPDSVGYLKITIYVNGTLTAFKQHRVIAMTWLSNPQSLPEVNHLDGNKLNNAVSNLEWTTHQANIGHGRKLGLWKATGGRKAGFKVSDETKVKMRKAKIGRKRDGFRGKWIG